MVVLGGGAAGVNEPGSEAVLWWNEYADKARNRPTASLLTRCKATNTCPKIVEHFGSAEVWALKLTPEWVGTDGRADLPLPDNVRRYYIASSNHGGGAGGFDTSVPGASLPKAGPSCPGNNFGTGVLPAHARASSMDVNRASASSVVQVGGGRAISPRRQRSIASAGSNQALSVVSPSSCVGVWPSGARATKNRASNRLSSITGVTQCEKYER